MEEAKPGRPEPLDLHSCQDEVVTFRGFRRTRAQILQQCQTEVAELEHKLCDLDRADTTDEALNRRLGSRGDVTSSDSVQRDVRKQIREKLIEYGVLQ